MATNRSRTDFIVVHCSTTPPTADIGVEQIRQWHVSRGWRDIGYHYVIRRDGTVEVGRNLREPGAHVAGFNNRSVGVCLVGGINSQRAPESNYTSVQWDSLWDLLENLCEQFPDAQIRGHRDFPNVDKSCPCFDVQTWWIRTRIDNSRVSVRSRIAYHLRAVDALLPQTFVRESKDMKNVQVLKWEIWEALSAAANLLDGAFDV